MTIIDTKLCISNNFKSINPRHNSRPRRFDDRKRASEPMVGGVRNEPHGRHPRASKPHDADTTTPFTEVTRDPRERNSFMTQSCEPSKTLKLEEKEF